MNAISEHVQEIERQIKVIKERKRSICRTLSFNIIPGSIVIEMIPSVVLWLNAFPPVGGISQTYSPRTIMADCNLDYSKHCRVGFETYAETHED